jgi:hypothetical protein
MSIDLVPQQTITLWSSLVEDRFGNRTFGTPVLIFGRWETHGERLFDENGTDFLARAKIYLRQQVSMGDFLALGDHTDVADPDAFENAYPVRRIMSVPDLHHLETEYRVYL